MGTRERATRTRWEAAVSVMAVLGLLAVAGALPGCGACWPGPCRDGGANPTPTPTPVPTPTPGPVCLPIPDTDRIDVNLWQVDSETCPRLLLDPNDPNYDYPDPDPSDEILQGLCESGVATEGETTAFTFRYSCNASSPWTLVTAMPGTATLEDVDVDVRILARACPGAVGVNESFVAGRQLEPILFARDEADIAAVTLDWEEGCAASDASAERLTACSEVCAGTLSLRAALAEFDITTSAAVDCYLALYDGFPEHAGQMVASENGEIVLNSLCSCVPNDLFADCLIGDGEIAGCFMGTSYDEACGEACWVNWPTPSNQCTLS